MNTCTLLLYLKSMTWYQINTKYVNSLNIFSMTLSPHRINKCRYLCIFLRSTEIPHFAEGQLIVVVFLFCLLLFVNFGYFVICSKVIKQEILKQSYKDLFVLAELPIAWLIIGSDSIYKSLWSIHNTLPSGQSRRWFNSESTLKF